MPMRTHYCGDVNERLVGSTVEVAGWVGRRRDHGGVIFVDLRDRDGLLQVVFDPDTADVFAEAERLRGEWVIKVTGTVRPRPAGTANANLASGQVELLAKGIEVSAETLAVDQINVARGHHGVRPRGGGEIEIRVHGLDRVAGIGPDHAVALRAEHADRIDVAFEDPGVDPRLIE